MVAREQALEVAERALEQLQARAATHAEAVRTQEAALASADKRQPACEAAVASGREAAARLEGEETAAWTARQAAGAAAERDALIAATAGLREHVLLAREHAVAAEEAHAAILRRRLDGIAAELAGRLAEGEACAVCGATDHPAPAHPPEDGLVGEEAVREARSVADTATGERDKIATDLADAERRLAAARATVASAREPELQLDHQDDDQSAGPAAQPATEDDTAPIPDTGTAPEPDDPPRVDLERRAATAEERAAETTRIAAALPDAERTLHKLLRDREETRSRLQAARDAHTEAQVQLAERREQIESERTAVARVRAGEPSIAVRMQKLTALADLADRAAEALDAAERAAQEADRALERAGQAARRAGFGDLHALRGALLPDDALTTLEQQITAFDEGLTQRQSATQRPELRTAAGRPDPDIATFEQRAAATAAAADQARGALADAERRQTGLRDNRTRLHTALDRARPARDRLATVREIADLTAGTAASNRLKMRLSAYVLAARLEEVAAAATVRLQQMSGGRYALEHTDAGAKGRSRGGLDLRIIDSWTGRDRPPSSLSGGETFLASLALALGLADVVTAEAGGAALETLFVDEGFGSLDDEGTLDEVLDVLDSLRDGGRVVGIVSHVPELRQRITTQLRIEKGRDGSRVLA
jgi:exonuclease SbcC